MVRYRLREIAQWRGFTQRRLWKESEIDLKAIQKMWRNTPGTNVEVLTLDRLAQTLQVDISMLIESDPPGIKLMEE